MKMPEQSVRIERCKMTAAAHDLDGIVPGRRLEQAGGLFKSVTIAGHLLRRTGRDMLRPDHRTDHEWGVVSAPLPNVIPEWRLSNIALLQRVSHCCSYILNLHHVVLQQ